MTDEKLKPCPFCGAKAHMWKWNGGVAIECSKFDPKRHLVQMEEKTEEEVIEAWNRRINNDND